MKTQFSKSILVLFSLLQLFHFAISLDIIQLSCKSAAKIDPYVDYKLCIKSLKSNPDSKYATFKDLVLISIEQSKAKAGEIETEIWKILKGNGNLGKYSLGCLKGCLELYSEAVSDLELAMAALKIGDYETAKTKISAAMDAPVTCEDEYKEKDGEVSPFTEINDAFFQFIAISLAFVNMNQ